MATNEILPFAPTDTGTNLLTQAEYAAAPDRTNGNQPGVASSKLVNKAIRQSSYVAAQIAQFVADKTGANVLDDNIPARLLAQLNAAMLPLRPIIRSISSSSTWNATHYFFIATGSATAAATYTNNGVTYTVVDTVASGTLIRMTGNAASTVSGTLTKSAGTGDTTLTFYAVRTALYHLIRGVGAGAGGSGSGTSTTGGASTTASVSTLTGTGVLMSLPGGTGASNYSSGGPTAAPTLTGLIGSSFIGTSGGSGATPSGGYGGSNLFGQGGGPGLNGISAGATGDNYGSGGGGGGPNTGSSINAGAGGGSGASFEGVTSVAPPYTYAAVIAAGTVGGGPGSGGGAVGGGPGKGGYFEITECFQ